jgi:hypothetical protein
VPIVIVTVPNGQTPLQRSFNLGASQVLDFTPTDVNCPTGVVCRLSVIYNDGPDRGFDPILEILTTSGVPVAFLTPSVTSPAP